MSDIQRHAVGRIDQTYPSRYGKYMLHADHVAALAAQATAHEAALAEAEQRGRIEERAGLIRDADTQHAYYVKRFGHGPEWGDLRRMLEDNWLARQRNGEFDDEVAERVRQAVSDERARIKAAVQALAAKYPKPSALIYETDVLAIIDGEDR